MGGSELEDMDTMSDSKYDWERGAPTPEATTVVLVGKTGNGKSSTGNSILGDNIFVSKRKSSAVTSTCELRPATRPDGRCIRVVDTPGLSDPTMPKDSVITEIMKCLDLANNSVHALLLVLSSGNRFTAEEMAAIECLETIFGEVVVNYMILVFTGGDELEQDDQTLDDFLNDDGPEFLGAFIKKCQNRKVLFDNRTKDKAKKEQQLSDLMDMIDEMVMKNGGKPYTSEILKEAQEHARKQQGNEQLKEQMEQTRLEYLDQVKVMVEEKLRLCNERFEERLVAEQHAREEAERRALADKEKSEADFRKLKEELELANKERDDAMQQMRNNQNGCKLF